MGATYLSMQLRTTDRDATLSALATAHAGAGLQFYVAEPGRTDRVFDFPTGRQA